MDQHGVLCLDTTSPEASRKDQRGGGCTLAETLVRNDPAGDNGTAGGTELGNHPELELTPS